MDEEKKEKKEKKSVSNSREERIKIHAAQTLIQKHVALLQKERDVEVREKALLREEEEHSIMDTLTQAELAYNKIVKTVSDLVGLYNNGENNEDESELDNVNKSLEKAKERFVSAGLAKDKFILALKKTNYALDLEYAKKSEEVFSSILAEISARKLLGVSQMIIEKEIARAIKKQSRAKKRLDTPDKVALDKLAQKREAAMKKPLIQKKRAANIKKEAAMADERAAEKLKDDIEMGYAQVEINIPTWVCLLTIFLLVLDLGSIVTVFVTNLLAWYALLILIPIGIVGIRIEQKYLFPPE